MTPAAKCRLAIAMTALAACGCGSSDLDPEPSTWAVAHEVPHADHARAEPPDPSDGLAENLATTVPARVTTQRVARSRPRPAGASSSAPRAGTGDVWARLAQCESGGDPSKNTGNGYYGAFQFSLRTWRSVGGSGLPSEASYGEQLARAQALQQQSGWGQWPACSRKLGLR